MIQETEPKILSKKNPKGPLLKWSADSGVKLLEKDGLYFKDLAKDGNFYPYEDWRLSAQERAEDLASRLSIEQIAGLMLYSKHQFVPGLSSDYFGKVTYSGTSLQEAQVPVHALSDQQKTFLTEDFLRHVLVVAVSSAELSAKWNNRLQALTEGLEWGIPVSVSSDPRHGTTVSFEFDAGAGGDISHWPESLGMTAAFDPELVRKFGKIASQEYRALGINTALSPQIDLSTEPRWSRFGGSFGEHSGLSAELAEAYCDGFQTSEGEKEIEDGWGYDSVNAMVKHWPGGGAVEGGRDAHFPCGKYSVYPGNNFEEHLIPFTEGAFKLKGKTKMASAVMPYYTIIYGQPGGENVGCSYSKYLVQDLLRGTCNYDGVVCTDWSITADEGPLDSMYSGKCWGVEHLSEPERCYKVIMAGVDQFGGLNEKENVLKAYEIGVKEHGEAFMKQRFQDSARRLLKNIFRTGLFENPYLVPEESARLVGCPEYMQEGFEAQLKSVVMLKNRNQVLPLKEKTKVYVPKQYIPAYTDWMENQVKEHWELPMNPGLLNKYFTLVDTPQEAEAAICFLRQPDGAGFSLLGGYDAKDRENGGNGYLPVSLQYRPYTAEKAREHSIAGGDPQEDFINRGYKGKTTEVDNECDLDMLLDTRRQMGDKPVIACVSMTGPMVMAEFEEAADAILTTFGNLPQALMEIISGRKEPSGLLPLQIPENMDTVEEQYEDVPFDMICHVDSEGHTYDFGYGLNWKGVIYDERVRKYAHHPEKNINKKDMETES